MPKFSSDRRALQRARSGLALAGNGCYLVGSVLYLVDAPVPAAWLFVVGSVAALLASVPRRYLRLWAQPRESEDGPAAYAAMSRVPWVAAAPVVAPALEPDPI